jgi:hypothetical protein
MSTEAPAALLALLGLLPSSRATTAWRSLRGERRPLSRTVGISLGLVVPVVQHRCHDGADVVGRPDPERCPVDPLVLVIGELENETRHWDGC